MTPCNLEYQLTNEIRRSELGRIALQYANLPHIDNVMLMVNDVP